MTTLAMCKTAVEEFTEHLGMNDDTTKAAISTADGAIHSATVTVSVIASVLAVEEFARSERGRKMAAHILSKSSQSIPDALKKQLQQLADSN